MMKFIFWQNVVSIHQSAFIKALAKKHDVILVAAEKLDEQRIKEKWNVPDMGQAKVVIAPSDLEISELISIPDTHHVFSGIDAYPMVYKAFKQAVKRRLPISVLAEPYEWMGAKGFLRRLKYSWLFLRYGKYIDHLFATGNMGVKCYSRAGFSKRKLHQWGYFTEQKDIKPNPMDKFKKPVLVFIGKIDERKNILTLVDTAKTLHDKFEKFLIIGTGPLEQELKKRIYKESKIEFIGSVPNNEIPSYLIHADLLVLPSLFDGWGAVVNEALTVGTRVLCSDRCGAEVLLDEDRGGVFALNQQKDLSNQLCYWLDKDRLSNNKRAEIAHWAKTHISGDVAAEYFVKIIKGYDEVAPWIK